MSIVNGIGLPGEMYPLTPNSWLVMYPGGAERATLQQLQHRGGKPYLRKRPVRNIVHSVIVELRAGCQQRALISSVMNFPAVRRPYPVHAEA
jgi:hypothetical protein